MTSKISPWAARLVGVNADGTFSAEFVRWLNRQLVERAGGAVAMTNQELADALSALAAGEMVMQPGARELLFVDVLQPATVDAQLPDVMQSAPFFELGAMTLQV